MLYAAIKALLSGVIIATVSEVAKRYPALGALILSLPLISILAFIWLWIDTNDKEGIAALAQSTSGSCCRPCRCSWCCRFCSAAAWASGPHSDSVVR
jgi:hypothetical protein